MDFHNVEKMSAGLNILVKYYELEKYSDDNRLMNLDRSVHSDYNQIKVSVFPEAVSTEDKSELSKLMWVWNDYGFYFDTTARSYR